jgi:hypothetical protein
MGFRLSGMGVTTLVQEATGIDWADVTFGLEAGDMESALTIAKGFAAKRHQAGE